MICIGITGGIGSGKSVVAHIFKSMGIPCYLADDRAKALYDKDETLRRELRQYFGDRIFQGEAINKASLASIVFNDAQALQQLNHLVHPAVARDFLQWKAAQNVPIVAYESALLFQSDTGLHFDLSIAVCAPEALRIERVCRRNHCSIEQVKARMQHQMPQEQLAQLADVCIVNDQQQALLPQVLNILNKL